MDSMWQEHLYLKSASARRLLQMAGLFVAAGYIPPAGHCLFVLRVRWGLHSPSRMVLLATNLLQLSSSACLDCYAVVATWPSMYQSCLSLSLSSSVGHAPVNVVCRKGKACSDPRASVVARGSNKCAVRVPQPGSSKLFVQQAQRHAYCVIHS